MMDADKTQIAGIRICHIMGYMVANKGGYDVKICINYFGKKMDVDIKDGGDIVASLSYLQMKVDLDPTLYAKYCTNNYGKLKSLFWEDE